VHNFFPYSVCIYFLLKPQGVTVRKRKYGLFVIDRVVQRQYLFRYGMQGYERFHLCLLAVDTDIPSALRICPDMMGMKKFDVHIRQPGQGRKDEKLDLTNLPSSTYILNIKKPEGYQNFKIIKK
jgi:hypothetical protein